MTTVIERTGVPVPRPGRFAALVVVASPALRESVAYTLRALGVERIRVQVYWSSVAPAARSTRRPQFDASNPEAYPPGLRQVFAATPMFSTVSTRRSRTAASRTALAAYYAAGETSTTICTFLAAGAGLLAGVPGSPVIFVIAIVWVLLATVTTTLFPKGDYYKARQALRAP